MFEKISFFEEIIEFLKSRLKDEGFEKVVWFGEYKGFPIIYTTLLKLGITDVEIVDNSTRKQGKIYYAYGYSANPNYRREIKNPEDVLTGAEGTLVLLYNTHFEEIANQVAAFGINRGQIIDLMQHISNLIWEREKPIVCRLKQLAGRELQLREFEILKHFRDVCESNNLQYFLAEGSLIGAVRHKGFIPWDDDIDVFMPFEDYEKFINNYPANEKYEICDWRIYKDYPFQFAKLTDKGTRLLHPCLFGYTVMGCCIDIFPMAGYPTDKAEIQKKWKRNEELDEIRLNSCCALGISGYEQNPGIKKDVSDEKYALSFYDSDYVGTMQTIKFKPWVVRKETFSSTVKVQFEGEYFSGPKGFDEYLTIRYGDYMKIPPENERQMHPYPVYLLN